MFSKSNKTMNKKNRYLMLAAWLLCMGQAVAGNVLTVSSAEVPVGGQAMIEIGCNFDTEFTAFELQLSLPDGLSLVTDDEGKPVAECGFEGSHVVEGNLLRSNGNYKFVCYSEAKASMPSSSSNRCRIASVHGSAPKQPAFSLISLPGTSPISRIVSPR